ncbi:MAG TPA: zf-TFIIB domain-containing protein [Tepidisphaeraceae bacterium]|nr:zf-TFIIB domain-containing protein [Tepidisphaeraceae bacterium]
MPATQPTCPHCGAAIEQNSMECPYCHAALETEICPKCFGLMFTGSKFCPNCGAVAESLAPQGTNLICPHCQKALNSITVANTPLDECPKCGGIWISVQAFDKLSSDEEANAAASGYDVYKPPPPTDMRVHYLKCPRCSKLMNRNNYGGGSGIIINVCKTDGIWLDRDELHEIIEFIRTGGMRKLQQANAEKAKEDAIQAQINAMNTDTGGQMMDNQGWLGTPDGMRTFSYIINSLARHLL